jgi:hypothetical protein
VTVEASCKAMINPEAMLAFSVWYSTQRLGRIQSMPAFDPKSFETAVQGRNGAERAAAHSLWLAGARLDCAQTV